MLGMLTRLLAVVPGLQFTEVATGIVLLGAVTAAIVVLSVCARRLYSLVSGINAARFPPIEAPDLRTLVTQSDPNAAGRERPRGPSARLLVV
jgi:hypothetical protein